MLNKKVSAALLALTLAGAMAVPALGADVTAAPRGTDARPGLLIDWDADLTWDETPLTRGELVWLLYQEEGAPAVDAAADYADVAPDARYAQAVSWAWGEGLASGYGDGTFGPEDPVTREQMAVILYGQAKSAGGGFTGAWAFPLEYTDRAQISGFAYEAVCWMTVNGVMGDTGEGAFAPQSAVSRRDARAILEQYFRAAEQTEVANPFRACQTMEQAADAAGFSMELPSWADGCTLRAGAGIIEAACRWEEDQLVVRKGLGEADISGDYRSYPQTEQRQLDGRAVTGRGEDGKVLVAVWQDEGYTYAVRSREGLSWSQLSAVIWEIR